MTRVGQNPAKLGMRAYQPQQVGIATIVYIPSMEGYFRDSLAIMKLMLESVIRNTPEDFDLLVFDNGSCREVKTELARLQTEGVIRWLILSNENLGKTGAQNWIFGSMPNAWICYTDSDVLFRSGWLEASREIINHFPLAGMVGAQPCFFDVLKGKGKAHLPLTTNARYKLEKYSPETKTIEEYCRGINATDELSAKYHNTPLNRIKDVKGNFSASLGASHMQFLLPREIARRIVPLPDRSGLSQEEDRQLDLNVDNAGALHLSTLEPFVVHIGNILDDWARRMAVEAEVSGNLEGRHSTVHGRKRNLLSSILTALASRKWTRTWMNRLYNKLFQVLSESK